METNFTPCQIKVVKEILHQVMPQQYIMEEVCLKLSKDMTNIKDNKEYGTIKTIKKSLTSLKFAETGNAC